MKNLVKLTLLAALLLCGSTTYAQKMQQQLMGPVITKAQDATKKVAQAAGYTIVFDVAAGAMAYYNEATVTNILPLVKKELGIVDKPAAAK